MLSAITRRVDGLRTVARRATAVPVMVRFGVLLCGLLAIVVAWPAPLLTGRFLIPLVLVALWPAIAPSGRGGTVVALFAVAGWVVDTAGFDSRIALWRVLTLATLLYLAHTLTALAALLPYDAMVNLDVPALWLGRAGLVILLSAVVIVLALGLTADLGGDPFQLATLTGLACAVAVTLLLAHTIRRR
ncbi:hypothetical protein [Actinoplanes aureus]|uniref:Uncharacterized protein n=1 Tax=Actinoplanes aureus TaxID=2792083 RepID=A0A931C9W2_9ACTN|nr:hypothetical protein [Actinoplanes aureus]MBG0563198.1 hypothetical protein [Actinoplanes aureus]